MRMVLTQRGDAERIVHGLMGQVEEKRLLVVRSLLPDELPPSPSPPRYDTTQNKTKNEALDTMPPTTTKMKRA